MYNVTGIIDEISTAAFDQTSLVLSTIENVTDIIDTSNSTTPFRLPGTPPPIGYYGEMKETIFKIVPPIIMVIGTVGNLLTVLVLLRQWKTFSSTSLYLMFLAMSDTAVLYTGPLRNWINQMWDVDIRNLSEANCRTSIYFTYTFLHFSSWLLVAVSVERAASVVVPHKVKLGCTLVTASGVILTLFIVIFGLNIVHPVMYVLKGGQCSPLEKYKQFIGNDWQLIDFLIVFAVPFAILIVCNIIIVVHLQKSNANRKRMTTSQGQRGKMSGRDPMSISILLISLCVVFFLSMTPSAVLYFYFPTKLAEIDITSQTNPYQAWYDYHYLLYQRAIVNIVSYTNVSLNFILYVFSGTKFRKGLIAMFSSARVHEQGRIGHTPNNKTGGESGTKSTTLSTVQAKILGGNGTNSENTETNTQRN